MHACQHSRQAGAARVPAAHARPSVRAFAHVLRSGEALTWQPLRQAANIVEALEAGARCLLIDEDTCATNFMIRDARMQARADGHVHAAVHI